MHANGRSANVRRRRYSERMILLGIDPGTAETGYGVITVQGSRLDAVDHGCITTSAREPLELRLAHIFAEVSAPDRPATSRPRSRSKTCSSAATRARSSRSATPAARC